MYGAAVGSPLLRADARPPSRAQKERKAAACTAKKQKEKEKKKKRAAEEFAKKQANLVRFFVSVTACLPAIS